MKIIKGDKAVRDLAIQYAALITTAQSIPVTAMSGYALTPSRPNAIVKTGNIIIGSVNLICTAQTGNIAQDAEIATFDIAFKPVKPILLTFVVGHSDGTYSARFGVIEENDTTDTRIKCIAPVSTNNIKWICVNFSYLAN